MIIEYTQTHRHTQLKEYNTYMHVYTQHTCTHNTFSVHTHTHVRANCYLFICTYGASVCICRSQHIPNFLLVSSLQEFCFNCDVGFFVFFFGGGGGGPPSYNLPKCYLIVSQQNHVMPFFLWHSVHDFTKLICKIDMIRIKTCCCPKIRRITTL